MVRRRAPRDVWGLVARTTVALGLACDVGVWGLWGPLFMAVGLVLAICLLAVLLEKDLGESVQIGSELGLALMACGGLLAALGWAGAFVIFLVAVTSPPARKLVRARRTDAARRRFGATARTSSRPDDHRSRDPLGRSTRDVANGPLTGRVTLAGMPDADGLPALDDGALCQAWRRSYVRLEASRVTEARLEVVRLRQVYLDELVRRHPAEVRHWLESGARAAGNPMPFLRRPQCQGGTADDGGREGSRGA